MCINEVKKQLTKKFKSLAKALTESERRLQLSVVNILFEHGDLKQLTRNTNLEFFDDISKQLPGNTDSLRQAFQEIRKSTDTYEDTIIRWIQPHLNELNPDKHLDPISLNELSQNNIEPTLEEVSEVEENSSPVTLEQIIFNTNSSANQDSAINSSIAELFMNIIDSLRNQVVDDCETTLQSMLNFPNQEAYSKFDKFVTQAFKGETASREWRYFYEDENNKSILWPDAEKKEKYQQVEKEWRGLVGLAIEASKDSGLRIES